MKLLWGVVVAGLLLSGCRDKDDNEKKAAKPAAAKADDDGAPGVRLKKEDQARAGIKTDDLELRAVAAESTAYGRLEEDPSFAFVARAPYAGMLRAASGQAWPVIGQTMASGVVFANVEPRLALSDRVGLNTQLVTARAELAAATEAEKAAQAAWNRASALNADNKNVSDRVLEEATAKLAAEKTRVAGAKSVIAAIEGSLGTAATADVRPVKIERGGEVVEVLAQPGESVEQGAPIVRLAQLEHLIARVEIPVGEKVPGGNTIRLIAAGGEGSAAIVAERAGVAAAANAATQGVALLYRLTHAGLRPGSAVTAYFASGAGQKQALVIPRSAVVQQEGRTWAYVQVSDDRFERRPVPLGMPAANGYVVTRGFGAGDRIVVTGAQTLLSEEFKSSNEADTN